MTTDITQVAQPTGDLQYVVYSIAVATVLIILGLAWIRSCNKWDGEERRTEAVESNVERFGKVERMISELATQVAVLTVEVRAVNSNLEKVENRLSNLENRLLEHIMDEEKSRKK